MKNTFLPFNANVCNYGHQLTSPRPWIHSRDKSHRKMPLSFHRSHLVIHTQTFFLQGLVPPGPQNVFNSCFSTPPLDSQRLLDITCFSTNGHRAWWLELRALGDIVSKGHCHSCLSPHFSTWEHIIDVLLRADYTSESLGFSSTHAQTPIPEILIHGFGIEQEHVLFFPPNSMGDWCQAEWRTTALQ